MGIVLSIKNIYNIILLNCNFRYTLSVLYDNIRKSKNIESELRELNSKRKRCFDLLRCTAGRKIVCV